jgi:hypothetical protein
MLEVPGMLEQLERTTGGDAAHQLPLLECLKSLDDLDEEEDKDDDDDDDLGDEEDEDDLDEDYDEDEDEDEDDDEDEDEEDEDDDGGVKPLKMARSASSRQ